MEFIDEDGEVHEDLSPEAKVAIAEAKRALASIKFKLLATVGADRRLKSKPCLEVMLVLLGFLKPHKRTLQPTDVYASATTIMARSKIRSKTTVRESLALLIDLGYLVKTGSMTKSGCMKFRVENPHFDRVKMSVREATEHYKTLEEEKSRIDRQRRARKNRDLSEVDTSETMGRANICAVTVPNVEPNYRGVHRGRCSSEGSNQQAPVDVAYGQVPDIDPNEPFPIPETDEELASAIADFVMIGCSPVVVDYFRQELLAGRLTMNMVDEQRRLRAA